MEREHLIYAVYALFFFLLAGSILATPLLAFSCDMEFSYEIFSYTCHQKLSRSLCVFNEGAGYWIDDCTPQTGEYITGMADRFTIRVEENGATGYKLPVCSRDTGLYMALLLGALLYPLAREIKDKKIPPAIFLIIAIVPIAIDGSLQIITELGVAPFVYESSNLIRMVTGGAAGLVSSFYAIPVLVNMFGRP
ncbi:DUF2085 domain-containing protein [Candidatus Micrarchaeota archaeon]|nr:DUF2085 domain-containing protein [Candidatus Micrarchaeota archaeon]